MKMAVADDCPLHVLQHDHRDCPACRDMEPALNESTILARAIGSTPLAKLGAMGHGGQDDYATCLDGRHWLLLPEGMRRLSDEERERLADEIEMDML